MMKLISTTHKQLSKRRAEQRVLEVRVICGFDKTRTKDIMMQDTSSPGVDDTLVCVSCYNDFVSLAHKPRGTPAKQSLYCYHLDIHDGSLTLLSVNDQATNPAFSRYDARTRTLYTCTEFCEKNGELYSFKMDGETGAMTLMSKQCAKGTSTCYITFDKARKKMLLVNYWDSSLTTLPLSKDGSAGPSIFQLSSERSRKTHADALKHVDHASNSKDAIKERQMDPHFHALVFDPVMGAIAYVPDLGMDVIRQFLYDPEKGSLVAVGKFPSGPGTCSPHGPRYLEFHRTLPICYVINELSSVVSVFRIDQQAMKEVASGKGKVTKPTLVPIQNTSTLPAAFPRKLNTCGRICVHPSGWFVVVSNRGHDSLSIFKVVQNGEAAGTLCSVSFTHTRGQTPRHFAFDRSGQWLLVANQDADNVSIFEFQFSTGRMKYTGNTYSIPSPNFVCMCS